MARRAGLSERRFGNYATDTREPDLHTLGVLARVLAIGADKLLGMSNEPTATDRDQSLAQIEAALHQLPDEDLKLVSVELRAVAEWRVDQGKQ